MDAPAASRQFPGVRHLLTSGWAVGLLVLAVSGPSSWGAGLSESAVERFRETVQPVLEDNCYTCHANGIKKGNVTLDTTEHEATILRNRLLWWSVLKNVRSGIMPPADQPRPSEEELKALTDWIKYDALGIDRNDPDPGRVTLRRLNRVEYSNTIRDLMGVDFRADEEFPPDDTGYGFDTIADVLTVSPLLLEKYLQAAETIAAKGVPTVAKVVDETKIRGSAFRGSSRDERGDRLTFYKEAKVSHPFVAEQGGDYQVVVDAAVRGAFDFDPGRCTVTFTVDDRELARDTHVWQDHRAFHFERQVSLAPGKHRLAFELQPLTPLRDKKTSVDYQVVTVQVRGPLDERAWRHPKNYDRFFTRDEPPSGTAERREYAREVLGRFARKAYRRPVDDRTLDRLVAIAEDTYQRPGTRFEEGISRAIVAVLASPRFLFRIEEDDPGSSAARYPLVDEYALASRLSYFLWSTMPDDELFGLAARGELRKNLGQQVRRMLADSRSEAMIGNFPGQWLQSRDIEGTAVEAREVLARDRGEEKELKKAREDFRKFLAEFQKEQAKQKAADPTKKVQRPRFPTRLFRPSVELDFELRRAMRLETELSFSSIVREDRSVLELLDSDSTFVNEKLAKFYGIPGVKGPEMRRVKLPADSPRGGILTQGTILVVTSNPTRTSPVKRGQFILDNILGTPAPPPPPDIPTLEEIEKGFGDREPTMREVMAIHRDKPLCAACHARMDPLGLALENFNAMGMARQSERKQPIDASGRLLTGEKFEGVRDLKRILTHERHLDYYRCLTEKLLTYALGRGLEDSDVESVDRVVERLEREHGRYSALLMGVIESAPFQKRRRVSVATADTREASDRRAQARIEP